MGYSEILDIPAKLANEMMLEPQKHFFDGKEKDFEQYIAGNIDEICYGLGLPPVKRMETQQSIQAGEFSIRPDILLWHNDGTGSVFEVKLSDSKHPSAGRMVQAQAMGQLLFYGEVITRRLGKGKISPRLFLFDNKIYPETYLTASRFGLPVTLVEIQGFRMFIPYHYYRCGKGGDIGVQKKE